MKLVIGKEIRSAEKCNIFELTIHHMHGNDDCARGVLFDVTLEQV